MSHPADLLRGVPLFGSLAPDELERVAHTAVVRSMAADEVLVEPGQPSDSLYVLLDGGVRVAVPLAQGDAQAVAILRKGDVFGELGFLDGEARNAHVRAVTSGSVAALLRTEFRTLRLGQDKGAYKVLRELAKICCRRIRHVSGLIDQVFANAAASRPVLERRALVVAAMQQPGAVPAADAPVQELDLGLDTSAPAAGKWAGGPVASVQQGLEQFPLFAQLTRPERMGLQMVLKDRVLKQGEPLYTEGIPPGGVFLVLSGELELQKAIGGSLERTERLATLGPGSLVGHVEAIDGTGRFASCRATRPSVVAEWGRDEFARVWTATTPLGFKWVDAVSGDLVARVRQLDSKLAELYSKPTETLARLGA